MSEHRDIDDMLSVLRQARDARRSPLTCAASVDAAARHIKWAVTKWQHAAGADKWRLERRLDAGIGRLTQIREGEASSQQVGRGAAWSEVRERVWAAVSAHLASPTSLYQSSSEDGRCLLVHPVRGARWASGGTFCVELQLGDGGDIDDVIITHYITSSPSTTNLQLHSTHHVPQLVAHSNAGRYDTLAASLTYLLSLYGTGMQQDDSYSDATARDIIAATAGMEGIVTAFYKETLMHIPLSGVSPQSGSSDDVMRRIINGGLLGLLNVCGGADSVCLPVHITYLLRPREMPMLPPAGVEVERDGLRWRQVGLQAELRVTRGISSNPEVVTVAGGGDVDMEALCDVERSALPLSYTLTLHPPLPLLPSIHSAILSHISGVTIHTHTTDQHDTKRGRELPSGLCRANDEFTVTLSDGSRHLYHIRNCGTSVRHVSAVSLRDPLMLPRLVSYLRQQGVINEVISSCRSAHSPHNTALPTLTSPHPPVSIRGEVSIIEAGQGAKSSCDCIVETSFSMETTTAGDMSCTDNGEAATLRVTIPSPTEGSFPVLTCQLVNTQVSSRSKRVLDAVVNSTWSIPHAIYAFIKCADMAQ